MKDGQDGALTPIATLVLAPAPLRASPAEAKEHDGGQCGAIPGHATVPGNTDPDNLVHDRCGNLWIATDGMPFNPPSGYPNFPAENDGIFTAPTEGPNRGLVRRFLSGVPNGEVCGPEFSGDEKTFFCAIQHPNDGSAFVNVWPIGDRDGVSKPSLIYVRHVGGEKIGSA